MPQSDFQCRWNWCRNTYPTEDELLVHVQGHVQSTKPCCLRDIPMLIRAEEGSGESMSGMTTSYGSHSQSRNLAPDLSSSLPSPPASSPGNARSLEATPERPAKRRRVLPPGNGSPFRPTSARPPSPASPPRDFNCTPSFASLASPSGSAASGSAELIQNPVLPDLNTLVAGVLRPTNALERGSQSFSSSDCSVERHLTQLDASSAANFDDENQRLGASGDSEDLYAGELNWDDDEPARNHPGSRSQTPRSSQSQSQSQPNPRRVSYHNKPFYGAQHLSPASILARQAQHSSPARTYLSGSLNINSPDGGTLDPRNILSQSRYNEIASQSQVSASSFVLQTQAPYRSQQSVSQ